MFFQTLQIALNGVTNIRHRLVARFPLGNTAGQSRAFGNKNAVFIRFNRDTKFHAASVAIGGAAGNATADVSERARRDTRDSALLDRRQRRRVQPACSLHICVWALAAFGDETVD